MIEIFRIAVERSSLKWLSDICDGDARIALNSLQLAMDSIPENEEGEAKSIKLKLLSLDSIKDGIKVSLFRTFFSTK